MDDDTMTWLATDASVDPVSGTPMTAVVFMLYYGLELSHFLLNMSDYLVDKYPLQTYQVGQSSVYLAGSSAHGFFLNTNKFPELRDFDVVSTLHKYKIHKECHYDHEGPQEAEGPPGGRLRQEGEDDNENICAEATRQSRENVTFEDNRVYLNVEQAEYPGYVLLRKCTRTNRPQTTSERYVSTLAIMQGRLEFWQGTQSYILQQFSENDDSGTPHQVYGPLLSILYRHGPAVNVYLSDSKYQMTSMLQADLVFALPYPGWPKLAEEWIDRPRQYDWPSKPLQRQVLQAGCEMVPVGYTRSPLQDFEWRISFSHGEMLLSRSLTRVQRELMHILKLLVSETSYHILNLMYSESEKLDPRLWISKNLGKMFFHFLDKYVDCLNDRFLPQYFIKDRNLLEKYRYPTVQLSETEEVPTEEHMESVSVQLHELRRDLLTQLLKQKHHLSLKKELFERVFEPFVEDVRRDGLRTDKVVYVATLVRLAKAHLYSYWRHGGNLTLAYVYSKDALRLLAKLVPTGEPDPKEHTDVYLTAAVLAHLQGDLQESLSLFDKLVPLMDDNESPLGSADPLKFDRRVHFASLYARLLVADAKQRREFDLKRESITRANELFRVALDGPVVRFVPYLDSIAVNMAKGDEGEADKLLTSLASNMAPHFQYTSQSTEHTVPDDHTSETMLTDEDEEVLYERDLKCRKLDNTDPSEVLLCEDSSTHGQEMEEQASRYQQEGVSGSDVEVLYERDPRSALYQEYVAAPEGTSSSQPQMTEAERNAIARLFSMFDAAGGTLDLGSTAQGHQFSLVSDENVLEQQLKEDVESVDSYYLERCRLALRYQRIGMEKESQSILDRTRRKLLDEYQDGERLYTSLLEYAGKKIKSLYDFDYLIEEKWDNAFQLNSEFWVISKADISVIDPILKLVLERSEGLVKLPHLAAAYHFKIQRLKQRGETDLARTAVEELQRLVVNFEGDCQWLIAYHWSDLGDMDLSLKASLRAASFTEDLTVQQEIPRRIDQLIDIVTKYEIRNTELDGIFV